MPSVTTEILSMNTRKDIQWAFLYFIITVLLGFSLRMSYVTNTFFNVRHVTHSHSHVGLLGWIYTILTSLICQYFLKEEDRKPYRILFLCTQVTILGMLFTFPFGGYYLHSIIFSSLFVLWPMVVITAFILWLFLLFGCRPTISIGYACKRR